MKFSEITYWIMNLVYRSRKAIKLIPFFILVIFSGITFAQSPVLLKDMGPGLLSQLLFKHDGKAYLYNRDISSISLWSTDGTAAGTYEIANWPNGYVRDFFVIGNTQEVGFIYDEPGTNGAIEFWKSDGTVSGTNRLTSTQGFASIQEAYILGTQTFLSMRVSQTSPTWGMWVTDGTVAGTQNVASFQHEIWNLHELTSQTGLYWLTQDSSNMTQLWTSDATQTGTSSIYTFPHGVVAHFGETNGKGIYGGNEAVYSSGGTSATTQVLQGYPNQFLWGSFNFPGTTELYYFTDDLTFGACTFYKTDGTTTQLVHDFTMISGTGANKRVNGVQYFTFSQMDGSYSLWMTDGTAQGTEQIGSLPNHPWDILEHPSGTGSLFLLRDSIGNYDLWITDNTMSGTVLLKDMDMPILNNSFEYIYLNGKHYFGSFEAWGNPTGVLWATDGTSAGTQKVGIFPEGHPFKLHEVPGNSKVAFFVADSTHAVKLWQSDGTVANTQVKQDFGVHSYVPPTGGHLRTHNTGSDVYYGLLNDPTPTPSRDVYEIYQSAGPSAPISLISDQIGEWHNAFHFERLLGPAEMFLTTKTFTGELMLYSLGNGPTAREPEITESGDWGLFPNPASTQLYLKSTGTTQQATVRIMDMLGKVYLDEAIVSGNGLDITALAPGVYLAEILTVDHREVIRFLKQ